MFLPQMSPMLWTTLMMMFILSYIMYMYILYFNYKKKIKSKTNLKNKMNWMW